MKVPSIYKTLGIVLALACLFTSSVWADDAEAEKPAPNTEKLVAEIGQCMVKERADILLITSEELESAWQPFAGWKTKTGRPAKIVTVEDIDESFEGKDLQEKIRTCCLAHIDHQQTRWVVLGGDSRGTNKGHVPDRDTHHVDFYKYKNIPTDIYYLSKGNWDANGDGIYGRFSEDMEEVNYTHEKASIGRIPVRTPEDVAAYTEKVIDYESKYPTDEFAKRMIYTCAVEHANAKLHTSKDVVKEAWDGQIEQFFVDKTPWDGEEDGDHELSAENWLAMMNNRGAGKLHMHGHGINPMWVLEDDSFVTKETVSELTNKAAYPVMTTVSCFTGQFDSYRDPCITESMLRKEAGGAIAIIAPAREGIPVFHERSDFQLMMTEGKMDGTTQTLALFWKHALKKQMNIGDAFRAARQDMTSDAQKNDGFHFVQCELNLLGDPSLCLLYTSPSPRDQRGSRMPSSA